MSKKTITAYICDKCKRCFRPNTQEAKYMEQIKISHSHSDIGIYWSNYDLCPDCKNEFYEWMGIDTRRFKR